MYTYIDRYNNSVYINNSGRRIPIEFPTDDEAIEYYEEESGENG